MPLTLNQAAVEVLREHGEPMGTNELWQAIDARSLVDIESRRPQRTLSTALLRATLGVEVTNASSTKLFYKAGPARFGLLDWLDAARVKTGLDAIMSEYEAAKADKFTDKHPVCLRFAELAAALQNSGPLRFRPTVHVAWSAGKGNWANVPWVSFLDRRETKTTQEGVYCVLLFRQDMSGVYVTFNQGVTKLTKELGRAKGKALMRERAEKLQSHCEQAVTRGFAVGAGVDLRAKSGVGVLYQDSTIAHKLYEPESIPTADEILQDIEAVLTAYDEYLAAKAATGRVWIFQANPKLYDLRSSLNVLSEQTWLIRQHKADIHAGDKVYLWEAGTSGGVLAAGTILSEPALLANDPAERDFVGQTSEFEGEQLRVRLRVEQRVEPPVGRPLLLEHDRLNTLSILKQAAGTNFPVTAEQELALNAMLAERDVSIDIAAGTETLIDAIGERGFVFEPWQIAAYVTALRTKPFVILAGVSGTGKSKLPILVAEATGAEVQLIPVRPDWTDSSDVLGYEDLQGRFQSGALLRFARRAMDDPSRQYVCVVDEMNLARVEHYFAEVLSLIEGRTAVASGGFASSRLISKEFSGEDAVWSAVHLPPNLALVGTVNMDESAHGFSRKVLDRAFTLELSDVDLSWWGEVAEGDPTETLTWPSSAWFPPAIQLGGLGALEEGEQESIDRVISVLTEANAILSQAQLQVGYRTRDEVALFVLNAQALDDSFVTRTGEPVDPLDLALQMKLLPRVVGGSSPIRQVVRQLLGFATTGKPIDRDQDAEQSLSDWQGAGRPGAIEGARFPRTAARLCLMWDRLVAEGFTSFWL
jgi:hypothetical protein